MAPVATSLVLFILIGLIKPEATPERDALLARINSGDDSDGSRAAEVPIPAQAAPGAGVQDTGGVEGEAPKRR